MFGKCLLRAVPVEETGTNAKNIGLVGMLMHDMRRLGCRGVGHITELKKKVNPSAILCLNSDLVSQVVFSIKIV